ncbi:hypothetical protein V6N13_125846 [Hibiscus sabdariffa]
MADLFSSAKTVADAAKSTFNNESDKVDKGKVAGAAADLLGAAEDYGKLDKNTGVGQYVDKAENYLHQGCGLLEDGSRWYGTPGKTFPPDTVMLLHQAIILAHWLEKALIFWSM